MRARNGQVSGGRTLLERRAGSVSCSGSSHLSSLSPPPLRARSTSVEHHASFSPCYVHALLVRSLCLLLAAAAPFRWLLCLTCCASRASKSAAAASNPRESTLHAMSDDAMSEEAGCMGGVLV